MRRRKKKYLDSLYSYESRTKTYVINVLLNDYSEAFNPYDFSQFKKRDLDSDFLDFIYNSSKDIPLKYNTKVVVNISKEKNDDEKNKNLKNAIKNNFIWMQRNSRKIMKKTITSAFTFIAFAVLFGALSILSNDFLSTRNLFTQMIYDGLVIATWVFMWKFVENLSFDLFESVGEHRYLTRLIDSKIDFKEI